MAKHADTPNYHPLVRSVARALRDRCGVKPGVTIVVGCSGGADSVALLRALALLAGRRRWQLNLIVGHVHHHLREEAEDDACFVESLARELGLAYTRRDIHPSELPGNLEANARDLRYQALADIAKEHDARLIATAHHADDQLETLLMRLLRGASVSGLRGIAWQKPVTTKPHAPLLIRPMLAIEQSDILDLLQQLDQPWQEDATNADTTRTRARLRHEVIPLLKDIQPGAAEKAGDLADHFRDLCQLVQQQAKAVTGETRVEALDRKQARALNPVVLSELLRCALIEAGAPADRLSNNVLAPMVRAAQDHAGGVRSFTFAGGICLSIDRDTMRITKA